MGKVAYRLDLPPEAAIHPTFHVSQLKPYRGPLPELIPPLPVLQEEHGLEPQAILDRKLVKRKNGADTMLLISWKHLSPSEATWEFASEMRLRFPQSPLWTRVFQDEGNAMGLDQKEDNRVEDVELGFAESTRKERLFCSDNKDDNNLEKSNIGGEKEETDGAGPKEALGPPKGKSWAD